MPHRKASATWEGNLPQGKGTMKLGSGAYEGKFSFQTRMGEEPGTNPEELIGAALAGCFSMALSHGLSQAGTVPTSIQTEAKVHFEQGIGGWSITAIDLNTEVDAPGLDEAKFQEIAQETKKQCPVSKALAATEIRLNARLAARA
jgi:osmotically inducible protein OsmC